MALVVPTVSLDQFHWIRLAKAVRTPRSADPIYVQILELAVALRKGGRVRFPLTADRYHETLRVSNSRQRIDVALAMAMLSGYDTMLQLDCLTLREIDAVLTGLVPSSAPPEPVQVFGYGVLHAFGRQPLADSLRIGRPDQAPPDDNAHEQLLGPMRAVVRELYQDHFEWGSLSGDPRLLTLGPSLRQEYDDARERFAAEERRRLTMVTQQGLDPRKAAYGFAGVLHIDGILGQAARLGIDSDLIPLDVPFFQQIPTIHVLAELLAAQYRNPQTPWQVGDWADMRTLCAAIPYCDVVAPDRHWASIVNRTDLPGRYETAVLASAPELLAFLEDLTRA